jgi:type III pantothenate kinase
MTSLLVDNSNTVTKFALAANGSLRPWRGRCLTADLTPETIARSIAGQSYDAVVLCSVVPAKARLLEASLRADRRFHSISHQSHLPITIDYPSPEQIGADRLANAVAAYDLVGAPAIVIDFGTAVTFDVIGAPGRYLGGAIAPGVASMTRNLSKRTALLPKITLEEPRSAIGKTTVEAMQAGAMLGYRGMIREIVHAICLELPETPTVIATGGDGEIISHGLPEISRVVPSLTLDGIRMIGELNG